VKAIRACVVVVLVLAQVPLDASASDRIGQQGGRPVSGFDTPGAIGDPIPRTGDQPLLVVLADFPDRPGLFTGQQWQAAFFGTGGFEDYFREVSYGQLRYAGNVVGLAEGNPIVNGPTVAYVRLPYPITYYADGQYGFGQFPRNDSGVVYDALTALDAADFDFTPYEDPATRRVENIVVVFAGSGYGYTQDPVNSLQATAWTFPVPFTSSDGQIFDNYTFCPDQQANLTGQIANTGICAHEHGHALGLPDLYDYSFTTSGDGWFDLMAYGLYGAGEGVRPFHPGAFSKEFVGWLQPTVASVGVTSYTLDPSETTPDVVKLYPDGRPGDEYFLLENRQALGFDQDWGATALCGGLLIWHVDQAIVRDNLYEVNTVASAGGPQHQGVVVVEADGRYDMIRSVNRGECSDTWASGTWDGGTSPSSDLWGGENSGLSVTVDPAVGDAVNVTVGVVDTCTDPSKPVPFSPARGVRIGKLRPRLRWGAAACTDSYNVTVRRDSRRGRIVDSAAGLTSTRYRTRTLARGRTYLWRVGACLVNACVYSRWWSFEIKA
jgi:M6 family metalloprotease-like protein